MYYKLINVLCILIYICIHLLDVGYGTGFMHLYKKMHKTHLSSQRSCSLRLAEDEGPC